MIFISRKTIKIGSTKENYYQIIILITLVSPPVDKFMIPPTALLFKSHRKPYNHLIIITRFISFYNLIHEYIHKFEVCTVFRQILRCIITCEFVLQEVGTLPKSNDKWTLLHLPLLGKRSFFEINEHCCQSPAFFEIQLYQ